MRKILFFSLLLHSLLYANETQISLLESDNIEVIEPEEMIDFIQNNQSEKPFYMFLSSEDGACEHCDGLNKCIYDIATERADEIDFVYVRFEKYSDINNYPKITNQYAILGMPTSFIVYNNKILNRTMGNTKKSRINKTIDAALQKVSKNIGNVIHDVMEKYRDMKSFKALYVAVDAPDRYAYGISSNGKFVMDPVTEAFKKCDIDRKTKEIVDRCKIYMMEDIEVYDMNESEMVKVMKVLSWKK